MTRVLFVGMNPARPDNKPSKSIQRLNRWADEMGVQHYSFVNCFHVPGDRGDVSWSFLKDACRDYEKVVALGGFASKCLSRLGINHFKLPHPSGRNRLLNDREFERRVVSSCRTYIYGDEQHDDPLPVLAPGPLLPED